MDAAATSVSEALPNLLRSDGPEQAPIQLLLAHGAGAGMDHAFMQTIATGLARRGIRVIRFEFPYMQKRRADGTKRPPDRMPKLIDAFADQVRQLAPQRSSQTRLFIGGKSMGGRVASLLIAEAEPSLAIAGSLCLGFPFHPPGKPERYRGEHLAEFDRPLLILQGERDSFGNRAELNGYPLSSSIRTQFLTDGDHSFKPRKAAGATLEQNLSEAIELMTNFMHRVK